MDASGQNSDNDNQVAQLYDGHARTIYEAGDEAKTAEEAMQRGRAALKAGNIDRSLYEFVRAFQMDNTNAQAIYRVGQLHIAKDNVDKAITAFTMALERDSLHAAAHEEMGLIHLDARRYQLAKSEFNASLKIKPGQWRSLNSLGVLADLDKEFQTSTDYYFQALVYKPDAPEIYNNMGYSFYLRGNWERAASIFKDLIKSHPGYPGARRNLALVLVRQENYDDALALFNLDQSDPGFGYKTLGQLCLMLGRHGKAENYLTRALSYGGEYDKEIHDLLRQTRLDRITNDRPVSVTLPVAPITIQQSAATTTSAVSTTAKMVNPTPINSQKTGKAKTTTAKVSKPMKPLATESVSEKPGQSVSLSEAQKDLQIKKSKDTSAAEIRNTTVINPETSSHSAQHASKVDDVAIVKPDHTLAVNESVEKSEQPKTTQNTSTAKPVKVRVTKPVATTIIKRSAPF